MGQRQASRGRLGEHPDPDLSLNLGLGLGLGLGPVDRMGPSRRVGARNPAPYRYRCPSHHHSKRSAVRSRCPNTRPLPTIKQNPG